jgi:hypothetical protein
VAAWIGSCAALGARAGDVCLLSFLMVIGALPF